MYKCPCGVKIMFPHKFYSNLQEVEVWCKDCDPERELYRYNPDSLQDQYNILMNFMIVSTESTETKLSTLENWYAEQKPQDSKLQEEYNRNKQVILFLEDSSSKLQEIPEKLQKLKTWYSAQERTPKNEAIYEAYKRWLDSKRSD